MPKQLSRYVQVGTSSYGHVSLMTNVPSRRVENHLITALIGNLRYCGFSGDFFVIYGCWSNFNNLEERGCGA